MIRALVLAAALAFSGSPAAAAEPCTVDDATLTWGFKESFRSYISGSIANGEWTVDGGATYQTPNFGWTGGAGELEGGTGTIAFAGSITFTGHGGILDTTVANPRLRFDGTDTATLLLDVSGTTQEGQSVDERAVEFATIDLDRSQQQHDVFELAGAPTTLTAEGAAAFGTYRAGEELDPISVKFSAPGCAPVYTPFVEGDFGVGPVLRIVVAIVGIGILALVVVALVLALVVRIRRKA